nr:hypothetical protein [Tanacetum cinerariifolium]
VIGQDVVTDIVTLPETNVIEENEIDMNVMQYDLNETTSADVVDVYNIEPEFVPTPNKHKYWVLNIPVDEKPKIGIVFNTFDDAYDMYKEYAVKARFSIRKSGLRRKKGKITHRSASTLTDCKSRIGLKGIVGTNTFKVFDFVENHNHPLIDASNMDLSRARRQLEFGEYMFIHRASLSNIGPHKAHRLIVALLGGFDKVHGMPIDWNNFKRDETMKCNYAMFGDIVSFDATYDTNKKAILQVFTQSHHRLCMWHITQKLPAKKYNLSENKWLSDMYEIRDRWVLGYFSEKYTQCVLDNKNAEKSHVMLTKLPIERHACAIGSRSVRGVEECIIRQRDMRRNTVDGSFECSCGHYDRHGFLCQHVFYIFGTLGMDNILENYISRRWRKNPLPDHLRDKRHRYGPCIEESESLASDIYSRVEDCINLIRNDPDKLKVFLAKVTNIKKELENDMSLQNEPQNKEGLYEDLLGVKAHDMVVIVNPNKCGNKGHRRFKSAAEKGKVSSIVEKEKDAGEVDVNESVEDEEDVEVDEDDETEEHDEDEDDD